MKYINYKLLDEKILYDKLDNGLEVYILRKKDFNTETARFFTNFGGLDIDFVPIDEENYIKVPAGIAHFLEHKLFEQENDISADEFYRKSGSYVNAFTNYKKTCYYFFCTNNFENNLNYLLDFVQSPYFTDENVEKERGIIIEEAKMGMDNPNRIFSETILSSVYSKLPYNNRVIGSLNDIKAITKEEIYKCYNTFYHPSNMKLLIVTNKDEKEILNLVKENQSKKSFLKSKKIKRKKYNEPLKLKKEYVTIKGRIQQKKLCYAIKLGINIFNSEKAEIGNSLDIYLDYLIGSLSEFSLELKTKNIIDGNISYSISFEDKYVIIKIFSFPINQDMFIKLLEEKLKSKEICSKQEFINLKKGITSSLFYGFNTVEGIMNFIYNEIDFYDEINPKNLDLELNLSYDKFKKIINCLNYDNKCIIVMESNE